MKKFLAVLFAVVLVAMSCVPAFAVVSPVGTYEYEVTVIPTGGGDGSYEFTTSIDENGEQHVQIKPIPNPGYTFDHWVIDGPYRTEHKLTDAEMDLIITGDITVTPYYVKDSTGETPGAVSTDKSPTSPVTGSSDMPVYTIVILAVAVCGVSVVKLAKSKKA